MGVDSITFRSRIKLMLVFVGDIFFYYLSLVLVLFLRYGEISVSSASFLVHITPFTFGLIIWLVVFYVGGMYERVILRNITVLDNRFFILNIFGGLFLILLLYFVPAFGIAPKTNLILFLGIFSVTGYGWRYSFATLLRSRAGARRLRLVLIGDSDAAGEIARYVSDYPSVGYEIAFWMRSGIENQDSQSPSEFSRFLLSHGIYSVIVPASLNHDPRALRLLYGAFLSGVEVVSLSDFYERLFDRVSLADLEDAWVLARLPRVARSYQSLKNFIGGLVALVALALLLPVFILVGLLVKLTSAGPVFYAQKRVGQNEEEFWLYKFRSMYNDVERNPDAEATEPTWSEGSQDNRITPFGRFLRATHIDELPQLYNIARGEMGFIGPRPERPEFSRKLKAEIPYYELRYLLKPGVTGWAQINYRYGSSVKDAYQKLQYEVYYLKNRSLLLDLSILFKTIKRVFVNKS